MREIRHKIGGIHPIDRDLRKLNIDESFKSIWKEHLLKFRKRYLEGHEWLIILGGNEGTTEEFDAANDLSVRIFIIPCFRGTGNKLWERNKSLQKEPCLSCNKKDGNCTDKDISNIVSFLSCSGSAQI